MNAVLNADCIDHLQAMPSAEGDGYVEVAMYRGDEEACLGLVKLSKVRALGLFKDMLEATQTLWAEDVKSILAEDPDKTRAKNSP